ncbi:ADP-ribosylglycohydrolase family protein [Streptomyces sp. 3214.6]|uniref:ADP-ribosylglycohydrolase family protein n=1 Tax=Streptomyces sp. 3214.6 TaxID=1882757 RepID=UPI00090CBE07|nr:ADP-ribosylglycohydrolase [Streptomyces sp. 3214.6]
MTDSLHAVGCVVGSAVGDALGAPFEFGPEGAFSERFPPAGQGGSAAHGGEMCGGGGWDPGEATDDTQMAVLVGESLACSASTPTATCSRTAPQPACSTSIAYSALIASAVARASAPKYPLGSFGLRITTERQ